MRPGLTGKDEQGELKVVEVVGRKLEKKTRINHLNIELLKQQQQNVIVEK